MKMFWSKDPFLIVYCPDKCKTQRMCDEAVDDFLAALKLIKDWFVTNKTIKKTFYYFVSRWKYTLFYVNENSGNTLSNCNEMGNNLDNNFDEHDPDTIILTRLLDWHIKFEKRKALKKKYKWGVNGMTSQINVGLVLARRSRKEKKKK